MNEQVGKITPYPTQSFRSFRRPVMHLVDTDKTKNTGKKHNLVQTRKHEQRKRYNKTS